MKCSTVVVRCRPLVRPVCFASNINSEQLRSQLDQLHAEAETARAKANNARLRLLRLSEAAEKLRQQAATSVRIGKENDARELLLQKKKVLQALEKSKSRIELLDKLSAKLNEAISVKETQLIGNIASDLEVSEDDATGPVRIISPKQQVSKDAISNSFGHNAVPLSDDPNLQLCGNGQENQSVDDELKEHPRSLSFSVDNDDCIMSSLAEISSYDDFLEHLDQQLKKIEKELVTILNVSTLVLDYEKKSKNIKVQQTVELLENIIGVRQRITSIRQSKVDIS